MVITSFWTGVVMATTMSWITTATDVVWVPMTKRHVAMACQDYRYYCNVTMATSCVIIVTMITSYLYVINIIKNTIYVIIVLMITTSCVIMVAMTICYLIVMGYHDYNNTVIGCHWLPVTEAESTVDARMSPCFAANITVNSLDSLILRD
jgi:hypothetical protein